MTEPLVARSVGRILPAVRTIEGEGMVVRRPFPSAQVALLDPFLLLDHLGPVMNAPGEAKGTPEHPHRGFETVTYLLEGGIDHRDSLGNAGHLGPGSVQWMTAGAGVVHSEKPDTHTMEHGGPIHGFQLWVNLRAAEKMVAPRYQDVPADALPIVSRDGVWAKVIAGSAFGATSPVQTRSPVQYLHLRIDPGASAHLDAPTDHTALVYVVSGACSVGANHAKCSEGDLAWCAGDGDVVAIEVFSDAHQSVDVLVLVGEPLREPVARYGPFVMNTREEILQAFDDYESDRLAQPVMDS